MVVLFEKIAVPASQVTAMEDSPQAYLDVIIDRPGIGRILCHRIPSGLPFAAPVFFSKTYAERWGQLADRIWEEEYQNGQLTQETARCSVGEDTSDRASAPAFK
jgi:hypothetical protein